MCLNMILSSYISHLALRTMLRSDSQISVGPQNQTNMMAQCYKLACIIQDHNLQVHPPIPYLLGPHPCKQPLHAITTQTLLDIQIQQQGRIPVLCRLALVGASGRRSQKSLDDHRPHVTHEAEAIVGPALPAAETDPLVPYAELRLSGGGMPELDLVARLPELGKGHHDLLLPVRIHVHVLVLGIGINIDAATPPRQAERRRGRLQPPARREAEPALGREVAARDGPDDLLAQRGMRRRRRGLRQREGEDGGLAAEFGVGDAEGGGPGLGAAQEVEVEGQGVGLPLGAQRGAEVLASDGQEERRYVAAVRDCGGGETRQSAGRAGGGGETV